MSEENTAVDTDNPINAAKLLRCLAYDEAHQPVTWTTWIQPCLDNTGYANNKGKGCSVKHSAQVAQHLSSGC